jgi:uncharacterized protein YbjT (DUF2867 family)
LLPLDDVRLAPVEQEGVARVAFEILRSGYRHEKGYDMTGPEALTMTEIAERISVAIAKTVRYVNVPAAQRRQALLDAGVPSDFADAADDRQLHR